ncbi:lysylphosphatidylglycerol synthase transmembrane domain-containing protein, partial [Arthrospira platensis SPKY1]|nr:lysylphosphatidylglycerol synthase transmembrane domain-containing protein [Arthrospira platensis SPKY1]
VSGIIEGFFALWHINLKAQFQGLMIPSTQGFDILRIYYIDQRHPNRRGLAGSTVFIERMIGLVLLCLLSLAALPFIIRSREFFPLYLTIILISATVLVAMVLILSKKLHGFYTGHKFKNKTVARIFEYFDKFHGAVVYFPYKKVLPLSLIWIAGYQLAVVFTIYLVFCAYGYNIPFIQHVAIFPVIAILSMLPITIGGFGVR